MKKVIILMFILLFTTTHAFATLSPLCRKGCKMSEHDLEFLRRIQGERYLTEAELLTQLDKEGRQMFRSLDKKGKELALRIATKAKDRDYKKAVLLAKEESEKKS